MKIIPIDHLLNATVRVPGSKSLTNRALLIAALSKGTTRLTNALFSDDSRYFAEALQALGFDVSFNLEYHEMTVSGLGGQIPANQAELFIGNAGTAARFLSAFLTLGSGEYILDGDERMRERPIGDLVSALEKLGAKIEPLFSHHSAVVTPPVKVIASGLPGGKTTVAGDISSQFLSALLMIAPYARTPVEIAVSTELNSKPYVDMTIAIMRDFGVKVIRNGYSKFAIHPIHYSPLTQYSIESDASAASYFFAAPAILGGTVRVENISRNSKQGDIAFLDVLRQMGCSIAESENSLLVTAPVERWSPDHRSNPDPRPSLHGIDIDMRDIPDTAQTLAAVAPFASSPTRIRGIASARVKETDRVAATCAELARLGVKVEEHPDGMTIYPWESPVEPGRNPAETIVQTYNDHRMAMAFSLIGLRVPGIIIEDPSCVSKTFPNFFEVLETLR